ncbi:MAG: hypothetical protein WD690_00865 [Vicinamibacterales bacterium]
MRFLSLASLLMILSSTPMPSAGVIDVTRITTIKGKTLEGTILGVIVTKSPATSDENFKYVTTYSFYTGDGLSAIDGQGLHPRAKTFSFMAFASTRTAPSDDREVVQVVISKPPDAVMLAPNAADNSITFRESPSPLAAMPIQLFGPALKDGEITYAHGYAKPQYVNTAKLLGELTVSNGNARLTPALRLKTAAGVVTIRVADVQPAPRR